jgi:hypothetical protein
MRTRIEILKNIQNIIAKSEVPTSAINELAHTEMFDITNYDCAIPDIEAICTDQMQFNRQMTYVNHPLFADLSLPFKVVLVKINEREQILSGKSFHLENHVFIMEKTPQEYIGFLVCTLEQINSNEDIVVSLEPVMINDKGFILLTEKDEFDSEKKIGCRLITRALVTLNNLRNCRVYDYTAHNFSPKYIRRKGSPTLKIENRPIYYVMDKNSKETKPRNIDLSKGRLSCSYAFKVRGHWRTLHNPKTMGLDRNGQRLVEGYTWIKEYIKGEGDLIKRVRVVK